MTDTKHEYVLAQLSALEELAEPLKRSSRLKYTCLAVWRKYLALGTNTGSIYVFSREGLKYLQVVFSDVETSPIIAVSLSPNEVYVAFATSSGQVVVMELNMERRQRAERVCASTDHSGCQVTALAWDHSSARLYAADNMGNVSALNIPSSKAKTLFIQPREPVAHLDSAVVQMACIEDKVLVSTYTRCYLINAAKRQYSQIGKKLRDGAFGATFYTEPNSQYHVIYCARPGSRIWEVDNEGNVLNTHQFKQLLAVPPRVVVDLRQDSVEFEKENGSAPQSVSFNKMLRIGQYLVTWCGQNLYLLDPVLVRVLLWSRTSLDIQDMSTYGNEIYIFSQDQGILRFHLLQVPRCLALLAARQKWMLAGQLLVSFQNILDAAALGNELRMEARRKMLQHVRDSGDEQLAESVEEILEKVPEYNGSGRRDSSDSLVRLPSGIFQVGEKRWDSVSSLMSVTSADARLQHSDDDSGSQKQRDFEQTMTRSESMSSDLRGTDTPGVDTTYGVDEGIIVTDGGGSPHPADPVCEEENAEAYICDINSNKCPTPISDLPCHTAKSENGFVHDDVPSSLDFDVPFPEVEYLTNGAAEHSLETRVSDLDRKSLSPRDLEMDGQVTDASSQAPTAEPQQSTESKSLLLGLELQAKAQSLLGHDNVRSPSSSSSPDLSDLEDSSDVFQDDHPSSRNHLRRQEESDAAVVTSESLPSKVDFVEDVEGDSTENAAKSERKEEELPARRPWSAPDNQASTKGLGLPESTSLPRSASWMDTSLAGGLETYPDVESSPLEEQLTRSTEEESSRAWHRQRRNSAPGTPTPTTLLQRLAAGGVTMEEPGADPSLPGPPDSPSGVASLSTRATLMAVKDRVLASKLTSKTKSLFQRVRGRNPLAKTVSSESFASDDSLTQSEQNMTKGEEQLGGEVRSVKEEQGELARKPHVDTAPLEAAVQKTKQDLQQLEILTNPDLLKTCLSSLASQLTVSTAKLHSALQKGDAETADKTAEPDGRHEVTGAAEEKVVAPNGDKSEASDSSTLTSPNYGLGSTGTQDVSSDNEQHQTKSETDAEFQPLPSSLEEVKDGEVLFVNENLDDIFHLADPFCLQPDLHSSLTDLATLCFQTGCHGNQVCRALVSKSLCQDSSPCHHPHCPSCSVLPEWAEGQPVPAIACKVCQTEAKARDLCAACLHDQCLAVFLRLHAHCLKFDAVKAALNGQEENFHAWQVVCQWSQVLGEKDALCGMLTKRDIKGALDHLRSRIFSEPAAILGHVMRLFFVSPSRAVELAAEMSKEVLPVDVLNMCLQSGMAPDTYFTNYALCRLGQGSSYLRLITLGQVCGGRRTRLACLRGLLMRGAPSTVSETARHGSSASPGEHLLHWDKEDFIDNIIQSCPPEERTDVALVCEKHRYWRGCLWLWRTLGLRQCLQQHVLLLRDVDLLSQDCPHGYLPQDEKEWQSLLTGMVDAGIGGGGKEKGGEQGSLTWPAVAKLLMSHMGCVQGVAVLRSVAVPPDSLPPHFFQAAVLQWRAVHQQRLVLHNALEKVDAYLWAKKPQAMAPQLSLVFKEERRSVRSGQDPSFLHQPPLSTQALAGRGANFLEDPDCHWGVPSVIKRECPLCGVLLEETVDHNVPGVLVFPCGHACHKACCPAAQCLECPMAD